MTNVIEKLKRNVLKITLIATALSSGHAIAESGVFFKNERTNFNYCEIGEASLLSANLTESEDVICVDLFGNGMDSYVPLESVKDGNGSLKGGLFRVTYDLEDMQTVERVSENELMKSNKAEENGK